MLKLDPDGNYLWAVSVFGSTPSGGNGIALDEHNNVLVTGFFQGTVDFDPGPGINTLTSAGGHDAFVFKLDSLGNFIWAKGYGAAGEDNSWEITVDDEQNVLVMGYFENTVDFGPGVPAADLTSAGSQDIFILKLDSNGDFVWVKRIGNELIDLPNSITVNSSGDVFLTGKFKHEVDFDPGQNVASLVSPTDQAFLLKLNKDGEYQWVFSPEGLIYSIGLELVTDNLDQIYLTGAFRGVGDFEPGSGVTNLATNTNNDLFVVKLDSSDMLIWAKSLGDERDDVIYESTVDKFGNLLLTGVFRDTLDLDAGGNIPAVVSAGLEDGLLIKLSGSTVSIDPYYDLKPKIYPNPNQGHFIIELEEVFPEVKVEILNMTGQLIFDDYFGHQNQISLDFDADAGLYQLILTAQKNGEIRRFIQPIIRRK